MSSVSLCVSCTDHVHDQQAAARTGLTIPVLRAWERRYGIVEPARTASGYRVYDEDAIARVRAMRRLVDAGWSPSAAAAAIKSGAAPADAEVPGPTARLDTDEPAPGPADRRLGRDR